MLKARAAAVLCCLCIFLASPIRALAGVVNPDISAIGQVLYKWHDDGSAAGAHRPSPDLGEAELVFDGYLNPYAKGAFVFTAGEDGAAVEEAYVDVIRGLPDGLALRGGKYRVGFGKLNQFHPHAYSFIEPPRVMAAMLPGEDGFNETGTRASYLPPLPWAAELTADFLNGKSFHPDEADPAAGWAARWSNSLLLGDATPLDLGVSAAGGTNSVRWGRHTAVYGADVKTKIPLPGQRSLTLQGEYFYDDGAVVLSTATGAAARDGRRGFYAFADLKLSQRWNAGLIYDRYNPRENSSFTNSALKAFAGFSLLEETTLLRLTAERFKPENSPAVRTVMLQVLFSLGPHKPHQF